MTYRRIRRSTGKVRITRPRNLAAMALSSGACHQRAIPSGRLYRRAARHRLRFLAEAFQ